MTESFRVYQYHHVLISSDDQEGAACSRLDEKNHYTGPATMINNMEDTPDQFFECTVVDALRTDKSTGGDAAAGFDAMAKYSHDPCSDFVRSMTEMIEAYSITESQDLEALFHCYLRLNAPIHHSIITLAFLNALDGMYYKLGRRQAS